jgi:EpsI family protein
VGNGHGINMPKFRMLRSMAVLNAVIFAMLMIFTLLLSHTLKPTQMLAQQRERMTLASVVPRQFGEWYPQRAGEVALVASDVGKVLADTYAETLNRTYSSRVGDTNDMVMLSMAYGSQQKQGLRIHRQEVCYEAQGFSVDHIERINIPVQGRQIAATRFEASSGPRTETVIYWFTMGDDIVHGYLERQVAQLHYTMSGYIPDGYLFRVSVIGPDVKHNTKVLEGFIADFFAGTPKELNERITGRSRSTGSS